MVGSLANGVSRFSRLFADHMCAEPDAVTTVPNRGLAITCVQGIGVHQWASQEIANLPATSRAWVRNASTFSLGALVAGNGIYFAASFFSAAAQLSTNANGPPDADAGDRGDAEWMLARRW